MKILRVAQKQRRRMPFSGVLNKSRAVLISIICWVYTFGLVQMHTTMNHEANKGQTRNTKDIPRWIKVMLSPSSSSLPPCSAAKQQRNVIRMLFGGWKHEKKNKSNDCIARFLFSSSIRPILMSALLGEKIAFQMVNGLFGERNATL